MFRAMFAVLIAGSIGYVLSGWAGMAVGATVASVVAVLTETLTPVIEQGTSHERRMRANRHYRARYEALEDSWRRPNPRSRRAWLSAMEPTGKKPAVAGPAPADPMLVAVDGSALVSSAPNGSTQGQLPAGSKRPGRSARAATSSHTSAGPSSSGKSGSKPARRSETGRQKRAVKAAPRPRGGTPLT